MTFAKTRYANVYKDSETGKFLYQIFLGRDASGKSKFKKGRRNQLGKPFKSAREAYQEAQRIKQEYRNIDLGNISYSYFMKEKFLPKYHGDVEATTYESHGRMFLKAVDYFQETKLKKINVADCEKYRTWLLTESGYSQSYASIIYTAFRQSLDYAVEINLLPKNPAMKTRAIPKGRAVARYWTKSEFEKVLSCISIDSFYERLIYVTFLFFYRVGCGVSEGAALTWRNVDLVNGKVSFIQTVHHKNKMDYTIIPYLKNDASRRTVTLDNELPQVLKEWKKLQEKYSVKKFFLSYDDTPLNKSTLSRWLKKYAQLAGVPRVN